jgi:hypothetical protein
MELRRRTRRAETLARSRRGAEVLIESAVCEDVEGGGEDGGGDGYDGLFGSAAVPQPKEEGAVVALFHAHGGPGGLDQHGLEPGSALANPGALPLACALLEPGTKPRPRDEVRGARKLLHVDANLGDQRPGHVLSHARYGRQLLAL